MLNPALVGLLAGALAAPLLAQTCFGGNLGTALGAGPDVVFPMQAIGFAFPLGGNSYTDVHITDHGYVTLSNAGVPAAPPLDLTATVAELVAGPPRICALWSDTVVLAANGGAVYIDRAANDCTITWRNAQSFDNFLAGGPLFDMQMKLSSSGRVEFFFTPEATNNSTFSLAAQAGLCGISPGGGAVAPMPSDLSVGGVTPDATVAEEWLLPQTFDLGGARLLLTPNSPGWIFAALASGCASTSTYGSGCTSAVGMPNSFYEATPMSGFDLANQTIRMRRTPTGYLVGNNQPGTFVPPSPGAHSVGGHALDDQELFVLSTPMPVPGGSTTLLNVTTKGQVEIGGPSSPAIDYTPTAAELLADPRVVFACWHDYDQAAPGSGSITFEEASGIAYVTWDGVFSSGTTATNTFQFQFDLQIGDVALVIGAMAGSASPDSIVVGYSTAGPSSDPGPTDLSSAFGGLTVFDDTLPLRLAADGLPTLGSTSFSLRTSRVPPVVPLAFCFVGDMAVSAGVDLSQLGMPGCFAYTNANLGALTFAVSPLALDGTQVIAIPNSAGLVGAEFAGQSVAFSLATPRNLVTSNGLRFRLGY